MIGAFSSTALTIAATDGMLGLVSATFTSTVALAPGDTVTLTVKGLQCIEPACGELSAPRRIYRWFTPLNPQTHL